MPEAWSSKFNRQRHHEEREIEHEEPGTTQAEAEKQAAARFETEPGESRGRRVAD